MKKGKPKPYVKKDSKRNKFMIYLAIGVMVFSGVYFGLRSAETGEEKQGDIETSKIVQYNVTQLGGDIILFIVEEKPEIVALLGEKSKLNSDNMREIMNLSVDTVYGVDGEVAGNSYVFFRFYTTNIQKAVENLTPKLDNLLGDYRLYRGYTGVQPSDTSMTNPVYLLGPLNLSRGSLVKVLLLEKSSGENKLGFIGFIKNSIPFGPVVNAKVKSIEGFVVFGLYRIEQELDWVNKSIPDLREFNYQPPLVVVDMEVNETTLNLSGVDVSHQANSTILKPVNESMNTITNRLEELGLNYSVRDGLIQVVLPLNANLTSIEEVLTENNITNLTEQKYGNVFLPEEVVVDNMVVPIGNNKNFSALLFRNATVDDEVDISLFVLKFGDQFIVNARQV